MLSTFLYTTTVHRIQIFKMIFRDRFRIMSGNIETQSHILYCEAYSELRAGKDLNSDTDLVQYMKNVLIIREKLNLNK